MSDRSSFRAHIYDCPDGQRAAALAVMEIEDLGLEFEDPANPPGVLCLTEPYFAEEAPCEYPYAYGVADALIKAAPAASFVMWSDPNYGYPGHLAAYTPPLGLFKAECDAGGEVTITLAGIATVAQDLHGFAEELCAALGTAMGKPWLDDWAAHQKTGA